MSHTTRTLTHRRTLLKLAAGAGVISTAFATTGRIAAASTAPTSGPMQGMVSTYDLGAVKLHTYMAPDKSASVTTHIVETQNALHLIDTQFLQVFAAEVRAYADSLGKPIAGVYLSHAHPDHILGAPQFMDAPFQTTADVAADCQDNIGMFTHRKEQFGDHTELRLPQGTLAIGATQWDGVDVIIGQVDGCEAPHTLTFHFPQVGLMIVQDLMYNNAHAFPLANRTAWIAALEEIRATDGLRVIGCGHGLPATVGAVTDAIAYLTLQQTVLTTETTAEAAIAALKSAYPQYGAEMILDFVAMAYK